MIDQIPNHSRVTHNIRVIALYTLYTSGEKIFSRNRRQLLSAPTAGSRKSFYRCQRRQRRRTRARTCARRGAAVPRSEKIYKSNRKLYARPKWNNWLANWIINRFRLRGRPLVSLSFSLTFEYASATLLIAAVVPLLFSFHFIFLVYLHVLK